MSTLNKLVFDNHFIRALPADKVMDNYRRQVMNACYSYVKPKPVSKANLLAYSKEIAALLGLTEQDCLSPEFRHIFSGNRQLKGMVPHAHCYGGHQFGQWAGQLGDGRVINLGEVIDIHGQRQCLQLKGCGETPYSRGADGLAVLRSSVREFLCSEAMSHLGIPTTRALSLITTGETVIRDMFYNGHPEEEPGAVICRVAPSFLRFGSYELFAVRDDLKTLSALLDYTIETFFPHLGKPGPKVYFQWLREVSEKTAELIVHWMRVGFVHGVMNTDNMSILGLTLDYGPYGWLDNFDPNWTPNTTDADQRRYRYANQAQIAQWNLFQLANALYPLVEQADPLREIISDFSEIYHQKLYAMRAEKLGMMSYQPELQQRLYQLLQCVETDMTIFFRNLAQINWQYATQNPQQLMAPLLEACYQPEQLDEDYQQQLFDWLLSYQQALEKEALDQAKWARRIKQCNPKYILRNYLTQQAIDDAEQGDFKMIERLLECMRHPYDEQTEMEQFAAKRPDWARHKPGCSMLSCSS